jgi:hypothetical protein
MILHNYHRTRRGRRAAAAAAGLLVLTGGVSLVSGCGGGGGGGGVTAPNYPSSSLTGTARTEEIASPVVSAIATDPATGVTVATLTNPVTGTILTNVVVSADPAFQPRAGEPALVLPAGQTQIGASFETGRAANDFAWASLYAGDVSGEPSSKIKPVVRARIDANGQLMDSVAFAGQGVFTLRFERVKAINSKARNLTIDLLNFVFQARKSPIGAYQTSLPKTFNAVLPAFGEMIAPNPAKSGWEAGGIAFTLDPTTRGGAVELFVDHANGQIKRTARAGNGGSTTTTQILMAAGGTTMGAPCRRVDLKCFFPTE